MIKKLTALICSIAMAMSTTIVLAEETPFVFYNAASNYEISGLDDIANVYAKSEFVSDYSGDAKVITARYDSQGIFLDAQEESVSLTKGVAADITTTAVSTSGVGKIKVFVWDSLTGLTPVAGFGEILSGPNNEKIPVQKFVSAFENADDYLYRVGNKNTVSLDSLFNLADNVTVEDETVSVTVESVDETVAVSGTFTQNQTSWADSKIQFTGTGAVKVTVTDDDACIPTEIYLEVIDAKNVTTYSELTNANCVLLNDITMSANGAYYMSNCTLYGNGFTFDVTAGKNTGGTMSGNYLISLTNATLDNVKVVGAVYTQYGAQVSSAYNNPVVLSNGNDVIANCYIANCSAPVRVNGANVEIINSTLKGGNFANLDIRNGNVTLNNVTTINQVSSNDLASDGSVVAGFGIVVYYEQVLNTTTININGLTQYNHLSSEDAQYIKDGSAQTIFNAMFNYEEFIYTDDDGVEWASPAIVSMTDVVGDSNISDVDGYVGENVTFYGKTGYVYTKVSAPVDAPDYESVAQHVIAPSYSFDYTTKNYLAKTEGSNNYCYAESGTVNIAFDQGETFDWDTEILTATKAGNTLDYTVSMNGTDYTDKKITFSESGDYEVVYTYTDPYNYTFGENGVTTYSLTYTKTVPVTVAVIAPDAKNAEFTMGSSNVATEKIAMGDKTYISATGVSHDNSTWSYITVNETQIYYPIVDVKFEDGSRKFWAYFPVFENVVTITDYADAGTGDAVIYNSGTTTKPDGLTPKKGVAKSRADITNWYDLTDSQMTSTEPADIFKYASSSDAPSDPVTYSNVLCYKSPEISADRVAYINLVQYSYTDATNTTYYYYVGYNLEEHDNPSCVTPETLITLADGSQKEIQDLTGEEELLVWNHITGEYDVAPVAYIVNHDEEEKPYEVINLYFEDGKYIEIIGEHVFFDATLNKYVSLDADAAEYIGDSFAVMADNALTETKLVKVEKENRMTKAYEVVTYKHMTCFTDDILSASAYMDKLLNIFEINSDTKSYDVEKMSEDINTYGLYTYEDFKDLVPRKTFDLYNAAYLKIAVGKGYITWDDILDLIEVYQDLGIIPLN